MALDTRNRILFIIYGLMWTHITTISWPDSWNRRAVHRHGWAQVIYIFNSYSSRTRLIWADIYIIRSYPASPRRITVLVNFQAILLISSGETSSNRDIFFIDDAAKFFFSDLQNFSTRNSPSVFPYLVKLNDNGSYYVLREPIRKPENHYPELKIY